jgi:hypothetical protein
MKIICGLSSRRAPSAIREHCVSCSLGCGHGESAATSCGEVYVPALEEMIKVLPINVGTFSTPSKQEVANTLSSLWIYGTLQAARFIWILLSMDWFDGFTF